MNAKDEFLTFVSRITSNVKCATITYRDDYYNEDIDDYISPKSIDLKVGYSQEEYLNFLNNLDFEYDNGYGGQKLFGYIWFEDSTYADRGEYDGSEWWQYNKCSKIPDFLM